MKTSNKIAMFAAALALVQGCAQGGETSKAPGDSTEPQKLEQPSEQPKLIGTAQAPVASEVQGRVLVQSVSGYLVRSERIAERVETTVTRDEAQGEQVLAVTFDAKNTTLTYGEPKVQMQTTSEWPLTLAKANTAVFRLLAFVPKPGQKRAYDATGCDSIADPLQCGENGNCCDTHDKCYYDGYGGTHCSEGSWSCPGYRKNYDQLDCGSVLGGGSEDYNLIESCLIWKNLLEDCNAADQSEACDACNKNAVDCVLHGKDNNHKPSSCCERHNCDEERPDYCEVQNDGTCACPPDAGEPACNQQADPCDPCVAAGQCCLVTGSSSASCYSCDQVCAQCKPTENCVTFSFELHKAYYCMPKPPNPPTPPGAGDAGTAGPIIRPVDPNDKVGPGNAEVTRAELWPYQINFENQDGATASAQEVVVVDYLDPNLDWSSVDFGEIHYGGRTITIPQGAMDFTVLDTPEVDGCVLFGQGDLAVRVTLSMDVQTGRFEARLKVIDPVTNEWPDDPYAGILPPGLEGCSQGHVTFTAQAKAGAPTGTIITNKADIVFDNNEPITTNEVSNTLVD